MKKSMAALFIIALCGGLARANEATLRVNVGNETPVGQIASASGLQPPLPLPAFTIVLAGEQSKAAPPAGLASTPDEMVTSIPVSRGPSAALAVPTAGKSLSMITRLQAQVASIPTGALNSLSDEGVGQLGDRLAGERVGGEADALSLSEPVDFIPSAQLSYRKISICRALRHSFQNWYGKKMFGVPLVSTDHRVLHILNLPVFFWVDPSHHAEEARDHKQVADNAKRFAQAPEAASWDMNVVYQIKKFVAATGWKIAWTDDPHYLFQADDQNKRVILTVGWAVKSPGKEGRRRSAYLANYFERIQKTIKGIDDSWVSGLSY